MSPSDAVGPLLTPLAASLPDSVPFLGPEAIERAREMALVARLGANESAFGPAPAVQDALRRAVADIWKYADPEGHDLRHAIARLHGTTPACVALGEGIDGILGLLVRLIIAPGDAVVMPHGGYPTFAFHVNGFGGCLHTVEYCGDHEDIDALLAKAVETRAKLVYLANPDNPMGSYHPGTVIEAALARLPAGALLVLDEAYIDLAPSDASPRIAPDDPRVIRLRTFSKAHGLAGLRVGYALAAPPLIKAFDRVRNHFALGQMAHAGALAALSATDWMTQVRADVATARAQIGAIATKHGLHALPSATNFVAVDCGADGAFARRVLDGLLARGIFVRMPGVAPLNRTIRISCAPPNALVLLDRALGPALSEAR